MLFKLKCPQTETPLKALESISTCLWSSVSISAELNLGFVFGERLIQEEDERRSSCLYTTDVIASCNSLVGSVSLMKVMKYPIESRVGICLSGLAQLSASEWQNTSAVLKSC